MIDLIIKAQSGDKDAAETLIKENDSLIRFLMKKHGISVFNEDYHSIGMYSLYRAIMSYDTSRDVEFSTYASKIIINNILLEKRRNGSKRNRLFESAISFETIIYDNLTVEDSLIDYKSHREFLDTEAPRIMELVQLLDELEQKLFMLKFIEDMTIPEIIERLGLTWSESTGSRRIGIVKAKLAFMLGIEYNKHKNINIDEFKKKYKEKLND